MKVKNFVQQYIDCVSANKDTDDYLQMFPSLFDHYFSFWSEKNLPFSDNIDELINAQNLILKNLPHIEQQLEVHSISTKDLHIVLFVGQNTTNGHAAFLDGEWWVWIPVESYITKLRVEAFVTHEMIHGAHYAFQPDFFFSTPDKKNRLSRQFLTEGLAMYCTSKVLGLNMQQTLWADYLTDQDYQAWLDQYRNRKSEIFTVIRNEWNKPQRGLFEANDPNDIFQYRAGYLAGFEIIERIAKQFGTIKDLLNVDLATLEDSALKSIKSCK